MEVSIIVCLIFAASPAFAGRAFPIDSENFVVELFSSVNDDIMWDPDNFLVDLSGRYSLCKHLGRNGPVSVAETTPEGYSVGGLTASYIGGASDANSVKSYVKEVMPSWLANPQFLDQIRVAEKFGCSVQPNCNGNFIITCLFSPGYKSGPAPAPIEDKPVGPKAQAFTPEQYDSAERIVGRSWDRSHLLENLSGQETDCAMLIDDEWSFPRARKIASMRGLRIEPVYGFSQNLGRTQPALENVAQQMKPVFAKFSSGKIGCSLIPHCMYQNNMYVVVSCLISY